MTAYPKKRRRRMKKHNIWVKNRQKIFFLIGLAAVFLLLFSDIIFGGYKLSFTNINYSMPPFDSLGANVKGPLLSDPADQIYPGLFRTFYSGDGLSLWDNSSALGILSADTLNIMNPYNWVCFLLPFGAAIFVRTLIKLLAAFVSMFLFMRAIGSERFSSALSGLIYTFSAAMVMWLGWPHTDVCAVAPLLFFSVERLIQTSKIRYMVLEAFVVYVMLAVGMPTYAAYFLYLVGAYVVVFTLKEHFGDKKRIARTWLMFGTAVVLGGLMSLPYTFSLVETVVANGYSASRSDRALSVLKPKYLRTFLLPYVRDGFERHQNECTLYLCVFVLGILPLVGVRTMKKNKSLFFSISAAVVFLLIFTHIFDFIFKRLPTINTSSKFRVIALLMFCLSVLSGIILSDIIKNREHYSKNCLSAILTGVWSGILIFIGYRLLPNKDETEAFRTLAILLGVFAVSVILYIYVRPSVKGTILRKCILAVIAAAAVIDCTGFAKEYFPLIDRELPVFPEATDSVSYIRENTREHERFVGLGDWVIFPDTGSLYGLDDIRTHNFIVTDEKMQAFYKRAESDSYYTATRIHFNNVDNYELFKYLGVKYIACQSGADQSHALGKTDDNRNPLEKIESGTVIRQGFNAEKGSVYGIGILLSTYNSVPTGNNEIKVLLKDAFGKTLAQGAAPLSSLKDNKYVEFDFEKAVDLERGSYFADIVFPEMGDNRITPWISTDYDGDHSINGSSSSGGIVMNILYKNSNFEKVYSGKDSVDVFELDEYSPKVWLAETVETFSDDDAVLDAMAQGFVKGKAFAAETDTKGYDAPLDSGEGASLVEYDDDYIKISSSSDRQRLLVINDYYTPDWKVYINGEETELLNVNYLMRGVSVPEGENVTVELKYRPDWIRPAAVIAIISAAAAIALLAWDLFISGRKTKQSAA